MRTIPALIALLLVFTACKKKNDTESEEQTTSTTGAGPVCPTCDFPDSTWTKTGTGPHLIFKFKFDSTQVRLNNLAQPSSLPAGNAGQSPRFNGLSAHYIEMAQNDFTQIGKGAVLYKAEETDCGGSRAIV